MSVFKRFVRNERGTTAALFGLSLIPLAGLGGAALDYGRMSALRTGLQLAADQTAMNALYAQEAGRSFDAEQNFKAVLGATTKAMLDTGKDGDGSWRLTVRGQSIVPGKEYKVTVSGTLAGSLVRALFPERTLDVGVSAVAVGTKDSTVAQLRGANLDPEAADYNETQAYCYDGLAGTRLGPIDPKTGARKPFVKIADNTDAGVKAGPQVASIQCGDKEEISFLVKNIREARTDAAKQRNGTPRTFYTDAVRGSDEVLRYTVRYNGLTLNMLETILCKSEERCQPKSKGGDLPNNHQVNRTPAANGKACKAGEFIYFGWEDRIWEKNLMNVDGENSDKDFDDIRMFLTCPTKTTGPFLVRLAA